MTQEFKKNVGQAVQADTASIQDQSTTINAQSVQGDIAARDIHHHHHAEPEKLTRIQRRKLHDLVLQLEEYGQPGKSTWRLVHEILGIDGVEEMHQGQYRPAEAILDLMLEKADLKAQLLDDDDNEALEEDVLNLQERLNESASAMGKLSTQNASLKAAYQQAVDARARAETQYAHAFAQIRPLQERIQALQTVAERARKVDKTDELRQQIRSLDSHLRAAIKARRGTRRKAVCASLLVIGACAWASLHPPAWLRAIQSRGLAYEGAPVKASSAHEHFAEAAKREGTLERSHVIAHHAAAPDPLTPLIQSLSNNSDESTTESNQNGSP